MSGKAWVVRVTNAKEVTMLENYYLMESDALDLNGAVRFLDDNLFENGTIAILMTSESWDFPEHLSRKTRYFAFSSQIEHIDDFEVTRVSSREDLTLRVTLKGTQPLFEGPTHAKVVFEEVRRVLESDASAGASA